MNRILILTASLFPAIATCQEVTTTPVGHLALTIPAGSPANPSYTPISLPLSKSEVFRGSISSLDSATQISLSAGFWTPNQFAAPASPHLARIITGTQKGRFFLITANTANQLTVSLAQTPLISDLRTSLAVGDILQILPAHTLGSVFGTTAPVLVAGPTASSADNVFLLNGPGQGWSTYYHNGTSWRRAGSIASQNNTILYPDEGILVVHIGAQPVTLNTYGAVPITDEKTDISGTGSTFAAHRFPLDTTLGAVGFQATTGWVAGATVNVADNVWAWSTTLNQWEQFYYNGANWRKAGSIASQNSRLLPAGSAVIVTRIGSTNTATLTYPLPYVP
jgi:uncharacterized protein (TIGR02597 family)